MKSTSNRIYAFIAALFLSFLFAACCLKIPSFNSFISAKGNINLLTYAMTVILFCLSFLILYLLINQIKKTSKATSSIWPIIAVTILIIGTIIFMLEMFKQEVNVYASYAFNYVWHKLPLSIVVLSVILEFIFFCMWLRGTDIKISNRAMYPVYALLTVLVGYNFYTPAVFLRNSADRLHIDAYFNSIYNVLHGNAYTEQTTSIYGHYAILYKLPLKILGGDFIDFILLNAIIGALCFLTVFLAIHFMIKNNYLRLLSSIAITFPVLAMRSGVYWQLWPHRILFMSIMLCYIAFCVRFRKINRISCILGYILSMIGILWNTETGLFCAAAWAAFWILKHLCTHKLRISKLLITGVIHFFSIILSFLGAYAIVNIYNILHDGTLNSIKEFLFPLMQSSYMTDLLRVDLPQFPSAYMLILVLLFISIAWGISHMSFFIADPSENKTSYLLPCFAFATAVLALGQITYFVNRAAYHNLEICHIPSILLLAIFAEKGLCMIKEFQWKNCRSYSFEKLIHGSFAALALGVLIVVTTGTLVQYGQTLSNRQQLHNKQDVHNFAAHIAAHIPENTYGFGIGVPELYAMLRWDTQCYSLDFADLSLRPQVGDNIMDDIKEKNLPGFFVGEHTIERMKKYCSKEKSKWLLSNYEISQEFEFQGAYLHYYTKKASE